MAIGNINDKVSDSAKSAVNKAKNKPEFESGFEDVTFDDSLFDNIFDDIGDFGSTTPPANNTGTANNGLNQPGNGLNQPGNGLNQPGNGLNSMNNPNGGMNGLNGQGLAINSQQPQQKVEPKPDALDIILAGAGKGGMATWRVFVEMVKSIGTRNYNDWADYGSLLAKVGVATAATALVVGILMGIVGVSGFSLGGAAFSFLMCGLLVTFSGISILTLAYYQATKNADSGSLNNVTDVDNSKAFGSLGGESQLDTDKYSNLFNELMKTDDSIDFTDDLDNLEELEDYEDYIEETTPTVETKPASVDYNSMVEKAPENVAMLTRKFLIDTFKSYFIKKTPGFSDRKELYEGNEEYEGVEVMLRQAFASACKINLEEMEIVIKDIISTHYCYIIRVERLKGVNKTDDIKREIEIYFRESATDYSVNAEVVIEGSFYRITITKGVQELVTMGDCLGLTEISDYYYNEKNKLPCIIGIDDYGKPVYMDARFYTTILIAGKMRSGKSWFVLSLIMSWLTFNTPDDIQLLLIDPKESNLFSTLKLMPHVCGLHKEDNILEIFKDIIEKEGARRKKLLRDNRVDDIWALREKGIPLPILFIVVDEFMTVLDTLGRKGTDKEFISTMNVVITQLPFVGIYLLIVPHRAKGVVDKTTREMMTFVAAIKATNDVVTETLGTKWDRPLPKPGDTAISLDGKPQYTKGIAITETDVQNMQLIETIARTFYKMGVDIPDMHSIGRGYNRDEDEIRDILSIGGSNSKKVQYNAQNIFDNLDEEGVSSEEDSEPD